MIESADELLIVFDGLLLPGINRSEALKRLKLLTGLNQDDLIEEVFSVKPLILKRTPDPELAQHFVASFEQAGLQVQTLPESRSLKLLVEIDLPFVFTQNTSAKSATAINLARISKATESSSLSVDTDTRSDEEPNYRLIFEGDCNELLSLNTVIENLQHLTGATRQRVHEELFSVKPIVVIESCHMVVINEYRHAYTRAGLKLRLQSPRKNPLEMFATQLRIRRDRPEISIRAKSFVPAIAIILFVGLVSLGWVWMRSQWVSPFDTTHVAKTITITIGAEPEPVNRSEPIPQPIPTPSPRKDKKLSDPLVQNPGTKSPPPEKSTQIDSKPIKPQTKQSTQSASKASQSKRQLTEREKYSNQLRLWLANKQNSTPTQIAAGMSGKVKLRIKINRQGAIVSAVVLSSTGSTALTKIATDDARRASPYPKIPKQLSGNSFSLDVSIRYKPTDSY